MLETTLHSPTLMSPLAPNHSAPPGPSLPVRTEPLRVLFLMRSLPDRGTESALAELMRRMNPARYVVEVCSLRELGALGEQLARTLPVRSHLLRHRWDLPALGRLTKQLKGRVDVVVTLESGEAMFWACLAARWAHTPAVLSILDAARPGGGLNRWGRLIARWTDGLITDDDVQREQLLRHRHLRSHQVHVIPRGIDTQRFCFQPGGALAVRQQLRVPQGAPLCGLAAGPGADGHEWHERRLLGLAQGVRFQLPAARFVTWATGERAGRLVARSAEFGLAGQLHVLPRGEELPRVLSALNVFCYLADEQTRPLPLLEAMAVQVPVVVSAGRQTASLVQSDCTGFCLEGDDLRPFATQVVRLINDPRLARRLGECGRQHVVKYRSLDVMVRRYEQLIGQTYQRKRSGPGTAQLEPLRDTVEFCGASS